MRNDPTPAFQKRVLTFLEAFDGEEHSFDFICHGLFDKGQAMASGSDVSRLSIALDNLVKQGKIARDERSSCTFYRMAKSAGLELEALAVDCSGKEAAFMAALIRHLSALSQADLRRIENALPNSTPRDFYGLVYLTAIKDVLHAAIASKGAG